MRLADRSLRQTNPVLGVVARLVELADGRLTASQVLDLADREPVRRRFDLDDDDLGRIEEWVRASGIRWGLDAAHREPFKLGALATGTWRAGLDRLLLGVTMTEDDQRLFADVLPLDDVESGAIDLAGRFAELLDRLAAAVAALAAPKPMSAWATALANAADALTTTAPLDGWQRGELQRLLDDLVDEAAGHATPLTLGELRDVLADRLRGRPTRANFRTGHLTVCTLVPMRSVPHRVVCLLGLDDGVFPRRTPRDGDDLLLEDPHVGERDPRTEDRQLLLDALMAASDRLLITYTGNDERTNLAKPPAVPVGELLDVIERTGTPRDAIVTRHPLQPFDPRNFTHDELVPGRVWSFDATTLAGAQALTGERRAPGPFLREPLPPLDSPVVELADLERFVSHPTRAFLRLRLGLTLSRAPDDLEDALSVELEPLEEYAVGRRLLEARLAGVEPRPSILAEIARGVLPPGVLGKPVIEKVQPTVEAIFAQVPAGDADVGRRARRAARRPPARGHRAGRRRRRAARRRLRAARPAAPDRHLDAAARADRRLPGRALRGGDGRPRARRRRGVRKDPGARRGRRARAPARPRRPVRPRHARAAAAGLQDVGRVRRGRSRRGPRRLGVDPRDRPRGQGGRAPARARRRRGAQRPDARARARRRDRPVLGRDRDAPLRPLGAPALGSAAAGGAAMSGFDVCGPLPTGVTVLEASAGTGKTYTIAALAARYVADGKPLEKLLLVTFTRMATGELRERVRERLVSAERVLSGAALPRDEVERLLLAADVERRRANLAKALADFDAATIATTHGFCQEVLGGLGVAGDAAREADLVEDVSDLVAEVVDDLYVRRFHREDGPPAFTRGEAARIATIAVANPDAPIAAAAGGTPAMRARLADAVRTELALRKQRAGVMTYDDLLTRLDKILDGPGGSEVIRRLRARFEVVLVDEFQDTDPVQWNIVRRAFGDAGALVLIGDPKQAIYAFRGADVFAYLEAAQAAGTRATLGTNRRSDQSLIDAYDALFGGARLGHDAIVYRQVKATPRAPGAAARGRRRGAADPPGAP